MKISSTKKFFWALKKLKRLSGFTLMELVVVIAILAILGTFAFIGVSSYARDARDAKRIENVLMVSKSFDTLIAADALINTNGTATGTNISIVGSGITLTGYYGKLNDALLNSLKVYSNDLTTYDGFQQYTYTYIPSGSLGKRYQVMAMLESSKNIQTAFVPDFLTTAYAATSSGYVYIRGNFTSTGNIVGLIPDPTAWDNKTPTGGVKSFSWSDMVTTGAESGGMSAPVTPVNGTCDVSSSGATLTMTPSALCSAGTGTGLTDGWVGSTFTWQCLGSGGGTNMSCQANHAATTTYCTFDSSTFDNCQL